MDELQVIRFLKALSDKSRLDIVRNLLSEPMYVELLAQRLNLTPPTVSFHLKKLEECGLVTSTREQYYVLYRMNAGLLDCTLRELIQQPGELVSQDAREREYRTKVIASFFEYGKLKALPVQQKKRRIVLEEIVRRFEPERPYPEKEVNLIIADVFDDFCTVRRDMVAEGLLTRANGIYLRIPAQPPGRNQTEGNDDNE